ncbi:hypothetical protein ARMGADRAFT_1067621 [Armillaria gallica]|uniref:Heterokaryon incompatibility domain-containing protein n=1 Tax=Armillaria gallica TaxID=47427 RepID=A0A2H3D8W0_ARMGA|nr:hypothetical protein ARMGADRAFT_1067621 [Armillaria gallica]
MQYPFQVPEVTISAFTETGQEESSIIIPKQRSYTGPERVISSRLADTPCATLGVQGLLNQLNTTLGTSHSLDNPFLSSFLDGCITNGYDFGTAYSRLRGIRYTEGTVQDELSRREEKDREERRKALVYNQIVNTRLPPRRVWDLYSNRVVPYWVMDTDAEFELPRWPRPISHAWVDENDRANVWTPINGYEWPVPIPKDANLNLIRIEMLNLGEEYTWLDVLCLRQVGGQREDLRAEEWKLDVPTIGRVYVATDNWDERIGEGFTLVCYLSGLGRPLTLKEGDLESDRSWFRRAWTLQEVGIESERVIAGDTPDGPLHAECKDGKYETELLTRFHEQLLSTDMAFDVREALEEMRKRVSTNPVDKIAGLAFLMDSATIPAYYESESLAQARTALVNSMGGMYRAELFLLCPEPGNAGKKWRPSWEQAMKPLTTSKLNATIIGVDRDETTDEDWCHVKCIEGSVQGLAVVEEGDRRGVLIVKGEGGIEQFKITAAHTYPIPEDTYTLIDTRTFTERIPLGFAWVVGRSLPKGTFEKVSMLQMSGEEQRRLKDLGITEERRHILI